MTEIGLLQQAGQDAFHVFPHIAGLREDGGVHDGEGHVQEAGDGLGQQGLARSGGPYQQDVRLLQLHAVLGLLAQEIVADTLVVVVNRHCQDRFGAVLADDVLIQESLDFLRLRGFVQAADLRSPFLGSGLLLYLGHIFGRDFGAVAADKTVQSLQQERDLIVRAAAEDAMVVMTRP